MKEKSENPKSKYGRKPLPEEEKRSKILRIPLNKGEHEKVLSHFGTPNTSFYIRQHLLDQAQKRRGVAPHHESQMQQANQDLVFQLKRIGGNLNQLMFRFNVGDDPFPEEVIETVMEVHAFIKQLVK